MASTWHSLPPAFQQRSEPRARPFQVFLLQGSKSIAKRKAEEAETAQHDKDAKRLRMEMKQRGHVVSPRLALLRCATLH
jgi:hypothetical protein